MSGGRRAVGGERRSRAVGGGRGTGGGQGGHSETSHFPHPHPHPHHRTTPATTVSARRIDGPVPAALGVRVIGLRSIAAAACPVPAAPGGPVPLGRCPPSARPSTTTAPAPAPPPPPPRPPSPTPERLGPAERLSEPTQPGEPD